MKLTAGQLKKIIKEEVNRVLGEMEIVNADSGEILTVEKLPTKYGGRLTKVDGYPALYDPDFESLRRDLTLDPDQALDTLEDLAADEMGAAGDDLGTAIDIAMGFKMSYPKEWKAALTSQRVKDMYYDSDMNFRTVDDALARFLAETMSG